MESDELRTRILTTHGEMQNIIRQLLKMLVVEHKHAGKHQGNPDIALSNIFKSINPNDVFNKKSLSINYDYIYDKTSSPPSIRPSIDIDCFDSTFMADILKSVEGLPTFKKSSKYKKKKKKLSKCMSPHHKKCCQSCDHTCKICGQEQCKKGCTGKGVDPECNTCNQKKSQCKRNATVCCSSCNLCRKCGLQLPKDNQCTFLKLNLGVDVAYLFRNLYGHLTIENCKNFLAGKCKMKGFECNNWDELSKEILESAERIFNFMSVQSNFNFQKRVSPDEENEKINQLKVVLTSETHFLKANFMDNILASMEDLKNEEISKEIQQSTQELKDCLSIMQKSSRDDQNKLMSELTAGRRTAEVVKTDLKDLISKVESLEITPSSKQYSISEYQQASDALKERYRKDYSKVQQSEAISKSTYTPLSFVPHDEIIVDVSLALHQDPVGGGQNVSLDNLITDSDEYTVISGVPGMGKTTLIKTLAYKWATNNILNGDKCYDFVFVLFCRNLNKYKGKQANVEDLIQNEYPQVFDFLTLKDLRRNKEKILLVVEGFDEFYGFEEFKRMSEDHKDIVTDHCQAMFDLLDPENRILPFTRIITGRPLSHTEIIKRFKSVEIRSLEILGFSESDMKLYIDKHFAADQTRAYAVKNKIFKNPQLKQLATRPVFCWAFCSLFKESLNYTIPTTFTAIYGSIILIFLRHHGFKKSNIPLTKMITEPEVKSTILHLAEIAYCTLKNGKLVFKLDDIGTASTCLNKVIGTSGLIETLEGGDLDSNSFQFAHLSIHEFLATLHIFCKKIHFELGGFERDFIVYSMPSSLLFLAGFIGGNMSNSMSHEFTKIYAKLCDRELCTVEEIKMIFVNPVCVSIINTHIYYEILFEFHNKLGKLPLISNLQIPPTHQESLSSYDTICIMHLFDYIKTYNDNKLPFKQICLNQRKLNPAVMDIVRPYLSKATELTVIDCFPGFIREICPISVNFRRLVLPYSNIYEEEWKLLSCTIQRAHKDGALKIEFLSVKNYFLKNLDNYPLVPDCVYRCLPIIPSADFEFSPRLLTILTSDRSYKSKLQFLTLIIRRTEDFHEFADSISKLPELEKFNVCFYDSCLHSNPGEIGSRNERKSVIRVKEEREVVTNQNNEVAIRFRITPIACQICVNELSEVFKRICCGTNNMKRFEAVGEDCKAVLTNRNGQMDSHWELSFDRIH